MNDAIRVSTAARLYQIPASNHCYLFHRHHRKKNSDIISFNIKIFTPGRDETYCEVHSERLF